MTTAEDHRLERLTEICAVLPESSRVISGSHASFIVRKKTYLYFLNDHHGDGIVSLCWRTTRSENASWVNHDASRFYLPAYLGTRGWAAVRLDVGTVDWDEVTGFVHDSYRLIAPKRLSATLTPRQG